MMQMFPTIFRMLGQGAPRGALSPDRHDRGGRFRPGTGARRMGRPTPHRPGLHHGSPRLGAALRRFRRGEHGGVAVESALALSVLVVALAGLMTIVDTIFTHDRMARAARAAAHSIALLPTAPTTAAALEAVTCEVILDELGLDHTPDGSRELTPDEKNDYCAARWTITVVAYESPAALLAGTERGGVPIGGENGDMVEVRIEPAGSLGTQPSLLAGGVARNERAVPA